MTTWPPGPSGAEAVQVGMVAVVDQPATAARPARPRGDVRVDAQQPRGEVQREGRLADPAGPAQQDGVRRPAADHRPDRGERGAMAAGPGAVHRGELGARRSAPCAVARGFCRRRRRRAGASASPSRSPSPACAWSSAASGPRPSASVAPRRPPSRPSCGRLAGRLSAWRAPRPASGAAALPSRGTRPACGSSSAWASAVRPGPHRPRRSRAPVATGDRLAGDLRPELRLELRRHLAPLARLPRRGAGAGAGRRPTARPAVVGAVLARPGRGRAAPLTSG